MLLYSTLVLIVFLITLIFFHELGHFLFAKFFGVRVEVFSIGFGPKILKRKWGETEYAISAIPFGGYVKMFGEDPFSKEQIPDAEKERSFSHKGKWARFWIVFGGPFANFLLAIIIFGALAFIGQSVPQTKLGVVKQNTQLYTIGFRTADAIMAINQKPFAGPADFPVSEKERINSVTIKRYNQEMVISCKLTVEEFFNMISESIPILKKPLFVNKDGKYFLLDTRSNSQISVEQLVETQHSTRFTLLPFDLSKVNVDQEKLSAVGKLSLDFEYDSIETFYKKMTASGYYPHDLVVREVKPGSPADKSGISTKDIIISLEGNSIISFDELRESLQKIEKKSVRLQLLRNGKVYDADVDPINEIIEGKKTRLMGIYSDVKFIEPEYIRAASKGVIGSTVYAFSKSFETVGKMLKGIASLFVEDNALKKLGGPIAIGKAATDSFRLSFSFFFQFMAMMSINLAIINLFPIPVLDGGHIMFIGLEVINRGPVSRRIMEIAQQIGLSLLLLLMFFTLYNDISKLF